MCIILQLKIANIDIEFRFYTISYSGQCYKFICIRYIVRKFLLQQ